MKKSLYIVNYDNWHFESYWNEMCEVWSIYQSNRTDKGYELTTHFLNDKPVATAEDAKERVEKWLKIQERIIDKIESEVNAE